MANRPIVAGGWSWYTGAAGWMYRAGFEAVLGFQRRAQGFRITSCVPQSWPSYEVRYRAGEKVLELLFLRDGNMQNRWTGPVIAQHDGVFALNLDSIGDSQPVLLLLLCVSRVALQTSERFTSVRMTTKSA